MTMARDITTIQNEIIAAKNADANLSSLNSPSAVAIWRLWSRIIAGAIETQEQLWDVFKAELEQIAREAVPGTADWLQKRVLEFQYSATNPQIITVVDGKATYSTIDASLRIITRAAVVEQVNNRVLVKVAKDDGSGGLTPLTAQELGALTSYLDAIGFVGIAIDTSSLFADRLKFQGTIYYNGQYVEATVKAAVITAIEAYLSSVSVDNFDGTIVREELINSIQGVTGVTGVDTLNVILTARPSSIPLTGAVVTVQRSYVTAAGYIIQEDTTGSTFNDTITMTLES
jgi:hypothetical protein